MIWYDTSAGIGVLCGGPVLACLIAKRWKAVALEAVIAGIALMVLLALRPALWLPRSLSLGPPPTLILAA